MASGPEPEHEVVFVAGDTNCKELNLLTDYKELLKPQSVKLGKLRAVNAVGTGNVKIVMFVENDREVRKYSWCRTCPVT